MTGEWQWCLVAVVVLGADGVPAAHAVAVKLLVRVDGPHPKVLLTARHRAAALVGKCDGVPAVGAMLRLLLGFGRGGGFARRIILLAGEHALEQGAKIGLFFTETAAR